jgi:pilus assembly protein FimV
MHNKRPWLAMVIAGATLVPPTALAAGFGTTGAAAMPALTPAPSLTATARLRFLAQANGAPRAPAPAGSSAADRIAGLERTVDGLRGEARANRELAAQLRDRLSRAEEASRWTLPLLAGVLFLTGLAAWLAWRLNAAQRLRQLAWPGTPSRLQGLPGAPNDAPVSKPQTSPIPFVASGPPSLPDGGRPRPGVSRAASAQPPGMEDTQPLIPKSAHELAMARTQVLPPRGESAEGLHREVSIEELIDLEQQAEFFVVLGQDDAAVELLVEHLRLTGGGSPLPYLKLLEIYRRRGARAEYERMRARYNQRFNAFAPDWDADLQAGRTLEAYPGVLPRLQQAWARPLDAMAELDALLFRRTRGELFELPAYREALLLYSVARDLMDREVAGSGHVDLLLPMAEGAEFGVTAPAPYLGLDRDSGFAPLEPEERSTSPIDLDLSLESDRPASIFDTLDPLDENSAAAKRR